MRNRSTPPRRITRVVLAAAAVTALGLAACDTGPGGTVDPDVVNGEAPGTTEGGS